MTEQEQIDEMARKLRAYCYDLVLTDKDDCERLADFIVGTLGYRKQAEGEHICCKDCKFSECCVVQIHTYSEEISAELHFSDPNEFYCAFAKKK